MQGFWVQNEVTRQQLAAIPVPAPTSTWQPVAYDDVVAMLHEQFVERMQLTLKAERYGIAAHGQQMFGMLTFSAEENMDLAVAVRNSYNKSISVGAAAGANVIVCENLMISGDAFVVMRKHTRFVMRDLRVMLSDASRNALPAYENIRKDTQAMAEKPCPLRRGYSYLGVALGEGLITSQQATVAFREWTESTHADAGHQDRNVLGLYQALTQGLKKGSAPQILDRNTRVHDWVRDVVLQNGRG